MILLILGEPSSISATIKAIQAKWETLIPEEVDSSSGVRFLGAELYREGAKWWMTQRNYIQDLLVRNLGETLQAGQPEKSLFLLNLKLVKIHLAEIQPMLVKLKES